MSRVPCVHAGDFTLRVREGVSCILEDYSDKLVMSYQRYSEFVSQHVPT